MNERIDVLSNANALKSVIPEQCQPCFAARMSADQAAQYFETNQVGYDEGQEEYLSLVSACEDGHSVVGRCGTEKSECGHPLGAQALAFYWKNKE